MTMLTDDELERLLRAAAAEAPFSPADVALEHDDEVRERRRRVPSWLPAAAAVVVALLIGREVLDDPAPPPTATADVASNAGADGVASAPLAPGVGTSAAGAAVAGSSAGPPLPLVTPRIVHDGSVEIEVERGQFTGTVERVTSLATGLGGHVSANQATEQGDAPRGTITVRVPAGAFEQLLGEVRRLGDVQAVATTGTDVTAQYTDLEARLAALRASREQLLLVLADARSVPDILAVQDRITAVQVEIDSIEGQRRLLADRSDFGTLAVTVVEPGAEEVVAAPASSDGGLGAAWDEAQRGFGDAVEWIVARSGKALVLAVTALVLYGVGVLAVRRLRRTAI